MDRARRNGRTAPRALSALVVLALATGTSASQDAAPPTLDETRVVMGKWIETQQILSRERKEWQQGKEILLGRLELVRQEVATLEERLKQAKGGVEEANRKRDEIVAQTDQHKAASALLASAVTGMEADVRRLVAAAPAPVAERLRPLAQLLPEDSATTKESIGGRVRSVLGILNELNNANNELTVSYEVHKLADGRPAEVRALYVGLAQAYFVSAKGEAGIGRPTETGWKWEPAPLASNDIVTALDILDGKHSPAFVPLPVRIR